MITPIQTMSLFFLDMKCFQYWSILRAAPYFGPLSNFKITANTQISSKSRGSAPAIFSAVGKILDLVSVFWEAKK